MDTEIGLRNWRLLKVYNTSCRLGEHLHVRGATNDWSAPVWCGGVTCMRDLCYLLCICSLGVSSCRSLGILVCPAGKALQQVVMKLKNMFVTPCQIGSCAVLFAGNCSYSSARQHSACCLHTQHHRLARLVLDLCTTDSQLPMRQLENFKRSRWDSLRLNSGGVGVRAWNRRWTADFEPWSQSKVSKVSSLLDNMLQPINVGGSSEV